MFCSSVRDFEVVAVELTAAEEEVVEAEADGLDLEDVEVGSAAAAEAVDWRRDLASNWRFSCSRSFWICFCSISDRLKTRLPPVSLARA